VNGQQLIDKTRAGGVVYGSMVTAGRSPQWASPVADLGLDYVIIDTEHTPRGRTDVADYIAALPADGPAPIIRVPVPASHYITMAIDAGSHGVLAPYCETVDEVREVVGATKWRPLKGALLRRVVEEGIFPSDETRRYLEGLNRNSVCIIGIESVPAVEALPSLLEVKGVDAVFVGPNDLTVTLGVPDQYDHPEYESALRHVLKLCSVHNVPTLMHHQTPELTSKWLREGAKFVLYSSDARLMHRGASQDFAEIRRVGEEMGDAGARAATHSQEVL
jgi:4-hydroxy-2-oxoheptanedioate aldolase